MKKLTYEEFQKRTQEVLKAQKIFGNLTDNISVSFAIYQEVLAEEKMDVFVSTSVGGNRPMTAIDEFDRPRCPECDIELRMKVNPQDVDGKQWNTSWVCIKCQAEFYSEKTVGEWMQELRKKDVSE
jgi:uncharacterized protein with PIN domain